MVTLHSTQLPNTPKILHNIFLTGVYIQHSKEKNLQRTTSSFLLSKILERRRRRLDRLMMQRVAKESSIYRALVQRFSKNHLVHSVLAS